MQTASSRPWDDDEDRADRAARVEPRDADAQVEHHVRGAFRFARALGAGPDLSGDLVQEAFVVAWQKGKQDLPSPALAAYLRRSIRYLWLQRQRVRRRSEAAIARAAEELWRAGPNDDGSDFVLAARACVDMLTGRAARAVHLAYGEGLDRHGIAAEMGLKPNGVKTLLARTRRWLQDCIRRRTR